MATFLLIVMMSPAHPATDSSSVTLSAVTSFGEHLPGAEVLIEGQQLEKLVLIKGRAKVVLPVGSYRFTSKATAYYWGSDRRVEIITPRAFVLIVLAPKEAFAINGEGTSTPYTVSGDLRLGRLPSHSLFVRITGLYLAKCVESDVDERGHFELAVERQGIYSIEVVQGELILCKKAIRLDESTERPLRVDLIVSR